MGNAPKGAAADWGPVQLGLNSGQPKRVAWSKAELTLAPDCGRVMGKQEAIPR